MGPCYVDVAAFLVELSVLRLGHPWFESERCAGISETFLHAYFPMQPPAITWLLCRRSAIEEMDAPQAHLEPDVRRLDAAHVCCGASAPSLWSSGGISIDGLWPEFASRWRWRLAPPASGLVQSMSEHPAAVIDRAVERLQGDVLPSLGSGPVVTRVLSVATRPFSYVARVESESPAATRRVIVKIPRLKPGKADGRVPRLKLEIAAAQALAFTLKGETALSVPDVVAFYPEIPASCVGRGRRRNAGGHGGSRGARHPQARPALARLEHAFRGAGRWLRVLQDGTAVEGREFSLDEMIDYMDIRLKRISELGPRGWMPTGGRGCGASSPKPDCRLRAPSHGGARRFQPQQHHARRQPRRRDRFFAFRRRLGLLRCDSHCITSSGFCCTSPGICRRPSRGCGGRC